MADKALGWDVAVTTDYTLAVDGVSTTTLTLASTREEIESALNETSGPVGLDVVGEGAQFSVSTDTPAELTSDAGATVTVTDPEVVEPEPGPDGKTPVRVTIRIGGEVWFSDNVYDPEYAYGGEGEPITFSATVAPASIDSGAPDE
jgi:hypothetical protein